MTVGLKSTPTKSSSTSFSHTVPSNATLLIANGSNEINGNTFTGCNWNTSEAMTEKEDANLSECNVGVYILLNPTPTTANVAFSLSSAQRASFGAHAWGGVNLANPFVDKMTTTGTGESNSHTHNNVAPGSAVISCISIRSQGSDDFSWDAGMTELWKIFIGSSGNDQYGGAAYKLAPSGGNISVGWSTGAGAAVQAYAHCSFVIPPAAAGNQFFILGFDIADKLGRIFGRGRIDHDRLWKPKPQILTPTARQVAKLAA